ncbi:MAG: lytic murein transglycosylase [Corynebacterium sp.]|nr:lytic murein transglycosylase [Corynebacterium sp.]
MAKGKAGCAIGCGILVICMAVAAIGWSITFLDAKSPFRNLAPVPTDVPPAAGEAVPAVDITTGGRTSLKLGFWAEPISKQTDIPLAALEAYGNAQLIAQDRYPQCGVTWNTLAGIGWVETRHGTYNGQIFGGSRIDENGYAVPKIVGIQLDGSPGFENIPDTDKGELDGDTEYDRAVGPMQFIPETWYRYGMDANGDGVADPNQIDDAAATAAIYLCDKGGDLTTPEGWVRAVASYNASASYRADVVHAAASYALGQPVE